MRFIKFGLAMLQLRFFSDMDFMSVADGLAGCVLCHGPGLVRVNAGQWQAARWRCAGKRLETGRAGSANYVCRCGSLLFFLNIWSK